MFLLKLIRKSSLLLQPQKSFLQDSKLQVGCKVVFEGKCPGRKYCTQRMEKAIPSAKKIPHMRVSNVKKDLDGMAYFLLAIPISAFCLGTWQVKRKKWKEGLIEELLNKTKIPAIDLPADETELADLEYRRVRVVGEFDHSGEMYLGPRSCLVDGESTYGGKLISTAANGSSGYYVITPFILSDTRERILVNRGWVSYPNKNPNTRREGQIEGEVTLEGVVRKTEPRQPFMPQDKLDVKVFLTRNVERMAEFAQTKPVFIDATVESTVPGGPIGGQTRASLRNEHLSYIITWYSLSAATSAMWYAKYLK